MKPYWIFYLLMMSVGGLGANPNYVKVEALPPVPKREFRGVWVTTVHNVDWPSKAGLSMEEQQQEFIAILDRCVELNLNAVVLQIRSQCDTIWPSKIEPWCPWFTGTMGMDPGYDPLAFALKETHRRGLELHAWLNPFRVINSRYVNPSKTHLAVSHKKSLRYYGDKVWLEPTQEFARKRVLEVVKEVLTNYDVDAIHLDDYFYPYPVKNEKGEWRQFNDYYSWTAYKESGGELTKGDWRREHVNDFVRDLRAEVKEVKPWVKFGISPFGIYRPGYPEQVKAGLDTYETLYTDVLLWWQEGWVDYLAPQLYWDTTHPQLGFAGLYDWWRDENVVQRHLWPGIATYRIKTEQRSAKESLRQIEIARSHNNLPNGTGHLHFSMKSLMENVSNVNGILKGGAYSEIALVPESPWLIRKTAPTIAAEVTKTSDSEFSLSWSGGESEDNVRWWVLQTQDKGKWKIDRVLPKGVRSFKVQGSPAMIALTPVGLAGELGNPAAFERME
tara:strand:- start:25688 stop:27190 length:1503 start_codon:yes stop_codon:yes gene_type:complete